MSHRLLLHLKMIRQVFQFCCWSIGWICLNQTQNLNLYFIGNDLLGWARYHEMSLDKQRSDNCGSNYFNDAEENRISKSTEKQIFEIIHDDLCERYFEIGIDFVGLCRDQWINVPVDSPELPGVKKSPRMKSVTPASFFFSSVSAHLRTLKAFCLLSGSLLSATVIIWSNIFCISSGNPVRLEWKNSLYWNSLKFSGFFTIIVNFSSQWMWPICQVWVRANFCKWSSNPKIMLLTSEVVNFFGSQGSKENGSFCIKNPISDLLSLIQLFLQS